MHKQITLFLLLMFAVLTSGPAIDLFPYLGHWPQALSSQGFKGSKFSLIETLLVSLDIGDTRIFCVLSRSPYGVVLAVDVLATYGVARLCERGGGGKSWKWGQVERRGWRRLMRRRYRRRRRRGGRRGLCPRKFCHFLSWNGAFCVKFDACLDS